MPNQYNKFNSRKLFLALLIIILGYVPILFKLNSDIFLQLFKEWSWLSMGSLAIYTGGNIGQKFSRNKNQSNHDLYCKYIEKAENNQNQKET